MVVALEIFGEHCIKSVQNQKWSVGYAGVAGGGIVSTQYGGTWGQ